MNRLDEMKLVLEKIDFTFPAARKSTFLGMAGIGILSFIIALFIKDPYLAWQSLLINNIFFTGLAHAALMFSVIFTVTDAYWGRCFKRIAEALSAYVPIGILLFFFLFLGGKYFFEWYDHDNVIHSKAWWLDFAFFVERNSFLMILVGILSFFYLKNTIRPDIVLANELIKGKFTNSLAKYFSQNSKSSDEELRRSYFKNKKLAPILGISYALLSSLIAFDWMMSIDQEWFSTMFGVQHLVSNLLGAGALLIIVSGFFREKYHLEDYITIDRYHDICKLTFAISLLWTYMIFSQVIVIWYANLPEETPFLILRLKSAEWGWMFWIIFILMFQIPFWGLMSKTACRNIKFSRIIAFDILLGLWLERYFIIVPSMQENSIGHDAGHQKIQGFIFLDLIFQIAVGVGLAGLFLFSFYWLISRIPAMPISDNRFFSIKSHH